MRELFLEKNYDGVLLRSLEQEDAAKVVKKLHDGPARGNVLGDTTAHKILRAGYYWTTLFKDAHAYVRKCNTFQRSGGRQVRVARPLQPIVVSEPFEHGELTLLEISIQILHCNTNIFSHPLTISQDGWK